MIFTMWPASLARELRSVVLSNSFFECHFNSGRAQPILIIPAYLNAAAETDYRTPCVLGFSALKAP